MENKDLTIKLMCKILYSRMGYVTHYEIKLRNRSYISTYRNHDISDIDVFGYSFNKDLTYYTVGSECKSGETNALDEFYKFLGISNYYGLDKAYLLKTKIHQNARELALQNGFICLSEAELRKMLIGFDLDIEKAIKIELGKQQRQAKALAGFKAKSEKLVDYIQLDYWNKENWRNIHNLIHLLKQGSNPLIELTSSDKYAYYYICELLAFAILKNASQAIILNYSDFEGAFINCLYGGAEALNEKRRINDAVNIATQEKIPFEPSWQSDLVNMSSRFAQNTYSASMIPKLIQEVYENSFFNSEVKIDTRILKKYPDITRKFVQDIMHFVSKNIGSSEDIFSDFMTI